MWESIQRAFKDTRTVKAVIVAAVFIAFGLFLGAPGLIDDPEFMQSVREFIDIGTKIALALGVIFARFTRS